MLCRETWVKSQYPNYSDLPAVSFLRLTHSEASKVPNYCQQRTALPKTLPTDAASPCWSENWQHHAFSYNARRGQFPRTRIGVVRNMRYLRGDFALRVSHFSAFHYSINVCIVKPSENKHFISDNLTRRGGKRTCICI